MPDILTSWKDISRYLGKGVRTVQRWEREAELPVRRQTKPSPHAVIAMSDELDAWARSRTRAPGGALAGALRREIATLQAENAELRARLEALEATVLALSTPDGQPNGNAHPLPPPMKPKEGTPVPFEGIASASALLDGSGAVRATSRVLHFAAQQYRVQALRARLSLASTMCALSERRVPDGDFGSLRRAQQSALKVGRSLECPGYVPLGELDELLALLTKLALRIENIVQAATCGVSAV